MASVLALSLSGSVSQLSVIVAAAALFGVMVLTLLFFAHAREVKRLREWGAEASDRLAELTREQSAIAMRTSQMAQRQAQGAQAAVARPRQGAAVAMPAIARAVPAAAARPVAIVPASPGTAVPGLPLAGELTVAAIADAPALAPSTPAEPQIAREPAIAAAVGIAAASRTADTPVAASAPPAVVPAPGAPPPAATVAAASAAPVAGDTREAQAAFAPATAAGKPPLPPAPPGPKASPQARPSASAATNGARAALPPKPPAARRAGEGESAPTIYRRERSTGRIVAAMLGVLIAIALLAFLVSSVLSKGNNPTSGNTPPSTASSHTVKHGTSGIDARSLRVVVLNATQTNGLAAKVASTLKGHGYSQAAALFGTPSGSYSTTTIQYAPGHAGEAKAVAKALTVSSSDVQPLSASAAPLSGGAPVVVIVGGGEQGSHETGASQGGSAEGEAGGETAGGGEATSEPGA
jgi:hypothetical protein